MGATADLQLPYPEPADANNPPAHIKALADQVQAVLLARFIQGDDARLVNARPPNGNAGGSLAGTYPSPSIANSALTDTTPFAAALLDGAAGSPTLRSLGAGAQQAAPGTHTHDRISRDVVTFTDGAGQVIVPFGRSYPTMPVVVANGGNDEHVYVLPYTGSAAPTGFIVQCRYTTGANIGQLITNNQVRIRFHAFPATS